MLRLPTTGIIIELMSIKEVLRDFDNETLHKADLKTLKDALQVVNVEIVHPVISNQYRQPDPRYAQIATVLQSLIAERLNQQRDQAAKDLHAQARQEAKTMHEEIKGKVTGISDDVSTVKSQLRASHHVHVRILWVAGLTAVLAFVAAWDQIKKWVQREPNPMSKTTITSPTSTNTSHSAPPPPALQEFHPIKSPP